MTSRSIDQPYRGSGVDRPRGIVRYGGKAREIAGVIFVDINAGYHERHTHWRWAAGAGWDKHGRLVAFNAITRPVRHAQPERAHDLD
jgi:hypothetical protein